jgi:hypothetical protein
MTRLVQVGDMCLVRVLQLGGCFLVELGRIRPEDEQGDCEVVEFHGAPFEPAERALEARSAHLSP